MRPILASKNSFSYQASVWLNNILTPLREHSTALKNTFSFVKLILKIPLLNQKFLVRFDVKSLFTNIPVNFTINLIIDQLFPDSSSKVYGMNKQQFRKLLNWTCNHTTFQFKGKFYKQLNGMAIRSPLAPAMADIFLDWFIDKAQSQSNCSFSVLCYVDDLLLLIKPDNSFDLVRHVGNILFCYVINYLLYC